MNDGTGSGVLGVRVGLGGSGVGVAVGAGDAVGAGVGASTGVDPGLSLGFEVGAAVGTANGPCVGTTVGAAMVAVGVSTGTVGIGCDTSVGDGVGLGCDPTVLDTSPDGAGVVRTSAMKASSGWSLGRYGRYERLIAGRARTTRINPARKTMNTCLVIPGMIALRHDGNVGITL